MNAPAAPTTAAGPARPADRRPLYEVLVLLAIVLGGQLLGPQVRGIVSILPILYFLIERRARRRSWADCGLDPRAIPGGLRGSWGLMLAVAIGIPLVVTWLSRTFWPAYAAQVLGRLPFDLAQPARFVPLILIATFLEEVSFRALFQEHLAWFLPLPAAIGVVAVAFGLVHVSRGRPEVVATDVALVVLDGVIYGVIFARSRNVFVAWIAHAAADLVALALLRL
jgi:membrane protease YdiL (CAAX protease family)